MKTIRLISLSFVIVFLTAKYTYCTSVPVGTVEAITSAIKTGNAKELAKIFNANIELVLLDKEDVYSKTQAELILKEFFTKNQPSNFTIVHQGGADDGAKYVIGNLKTRSEM